MNAALGRTARHPRRQALIFIVLTSPVMFGSRYLPLPNGAVLVLLLLIATLLLLRFEGRGAAELGLDLSWRRVREFAGGLAGGAAIVLLIAATLRVVLPFAWERNPHFELAALGSAFLCFLTSNVAEELAFRGYGFDRLIAWIGHWPAQLVTAVLFAIGHLLMGWPWLAVLTGVPAGSLLFGLVFVRWRSLPAAIGVHVAFNWVRELLLEDPARPATVFGPHSARMWTREEQILASLVFTAIALLVCVALARSISSRRQIPPQAGTAPTL